MASPILCRACMRSLQRNPQSQITPRPTTITSRSSLLSIRSFTSTHRLPTETPPKRKQNPPEVIQNLAATIRQNQSLRSTTEPLVAYGVTETLFLECSKQCTYTIPTALASPRQEPPRTPEGEDLGQGEGWWFKPSSTGGLGLDVTFSTWAQVMFLHMYLLTARLRAFPEEQSAVWQRNLVEHFFYAAEDRMAVWHGMDSRGVRNRYLKDLWLQWRGVLISYDEGLIKGDAVLAAAVWRNVFKARREVDVLDVALVTAYMRREMKGLEGLGDEQIASAKVRFGSPDKLRELIGKTSPWMNKTFTDEDVKELKQE